MGDVAVRFDANTASFDWAIVNGDLADTVALQTTDLESSVIISLFTDRVAQPDYVLPRGTINQRGYWGDCYEPSPLGSWLWQLRSMPSTSTSLQVARQMCTSALQWMIDIGLVASLVVKTSWLRPNDTSAMQIDIMLVEPVTKATTRFQFSWAWQQVYDTLPAIQKVAAPSIFDQAVWSVSPFEGLQQNVFDAGQIDVNVFE